MPNKPNKSQSEAVDKIHKITREYNMCAFLLVDADLEEVANDNGTEFTQEEKDEIYERFHSGMLEVYSEILEMICTDIIDERE